MKETQKLEETFFHEMCMQCLLFNEYRLTITKVLRMRRCFIQKWEGRERA